MKFSIQANPVSDLAICLLHSVTNAHILHLQTKSFSEHMALEAFYTEIGDLADGFIEAYQGKYGLLQYPNTYTPPSLPLPYLTYLKDELETLRRKPEFPQDSELQNDLDTIAITRQYGDNVYYFRRITNWHSSRHCLFRPA